MEESYNEKYDVFISYSRKDYVDENNIIIPGNVVSKVKDILDKMKVKYWFDVDGIYCGDEFAPLIARAIKNSKIFLFISSHNSNASDWTSNEIAVAHAYKKKIIPFRIDNSVYNESIIIYIAKLEYIDYTKNHALAMTRMSDSIEKYLNQIAKQEKLAEEEKQKEEERLKQAIENERELSRIRERLTNVSKELDSLRSQWQVSSTLFDELKAKEAVLLGKPYQHRSLKIDQGPDSYNENPGRNGENKEKTDETFSLRTMLKIYPPDGKEIHPLVYIVLRLFLYVSLSATIIFLIAGFNSDHSEDRILFFLSSLYFCIFFLSLFYVFKWKRNAFYVFTAVLIALFLFFSVLSFHFKYWLLSILILLLLVVVIFALYRVKYNGKTIYEQTE